MLCDIGSTASILVSQKIPYIDTMRAYFVQIARRKPLAAFLQSSRRTTVAGRARQRVVLSSTTPPHSSSACRCFSSTDLSTTKTPTSSPDARTSKDGVVGRPIDFDVSAKIEGNESQILSVTLEPGQVLRAESGAMMYMTEGVQMNTTTGGGLSSSFQRMLTGQNFFISDYTYEGNDVGYVALGTDFPSKIVRLNVQEYGGKIVCQKGALLCASHTVDIQMEFSKNFTTGFFGGEGFVLQGLTGEGDVFVKAGGTLIRRELKEGEELRISSGCLVAFSDGVDYGKSPLFACRSVGVCRVQYFLTLALPDSS